MVKIYFVTLLLVTVCEVALAARILFLFPIHSKSHLVIVHALSTTLAQRGHDVTVFSPFPLEKPVKNHREIKSPIPKDAAEVMQRITNGESIIWAMLEMFNAIVDMAEKTIEMQEFQMLLKEEQFDLIVIGMIMNNFLLGFGEHFKCPTMMLSVQPSFTQTNVIFGNPFGVNAVPHMLADFNANMGFVNRVKNFIFYSGELALTAYMYYAQKKTYEKHFPSDRFVSYDEAVANLSVVLQNGHFSQSGVRTNVPAMIEVGGLQIKPTPDPLPVQIQQWLDEAEDGAIFFSFGTNAKASLLPREKLEILLKVFSELKQRVIMKWESDTLEGKPDNVLIGSWLPQDDILAHKNVKLFVSHCGLGGTVESKFHGVPIVGVPIFGDQSSNAADVAKEGWAVIVDFATLTEEKLSNAINEVLNNPKYSSTVKRLSQLYRDRPMNARDTAVYWVEYVIRHHGAPHLKYPGARLNFWQSKSLDVVGFLLVAFYVFVKLSVVIGRFCLSKICKKSAGVEHKKKKN